MFYEGVVEKDSWSHLWSFERNRLCIRDVNNNGQIVHRMSEIVYTSYQRFTEFFDLLLDALSSLQPFITVRDYIQATIFPKTSKEK